MIENQVKKKFKRLNVNQLHSFKDHPFKVIDNEDMDNLIDSIKEQGILMPLIVRPIPNSETDYEIVSGHRRLHAAIKAGLTEVPTLVYELDKDQAIIAMVDSNLNRETILPSEKAFAYKMKNDAMKSQGKRNDLTSDPVGRKLAGIETTQIIGGSNGDSQTQVKRYIRLTHLIPELLDYVDEGKIKMRPAVELSYLSEEEQAMVYDEMKYFDCTPSHTQSIKLKEISQQSYLSTEIIKMIMSEQKPNQQEHISFKLDELKKYFPKDYKQKDIYEAVIKLAEKDYKRRQRINSRDER